MNKAKSYKIVFLLCAFVMFTCAIFSFVFSPKPVNAEKANNFFEGISETNLNFEDGDVVATVANGDTLKLKNPLVVNQLQFAIEIPEQITSVTMTFGTESYLMNGNVVDDFDPTADNIDEDDLEVVNEVKHELVINNEDGSWTFDGVAGANVSTDVVSIYFSVVNGNFVWASLENGNTGFVGSNEQAYKVKNVDKAVAFDIAFKFAVKDGVTGDFVIDYIDQNYKETSGNYKQEFTVDSDKNLTNFADARVVLDDSAFVFNGETYTAQAVVGWLNTYSATAYSVVGSNYAGTLTYTAEGTESDIFVSKGNDPQICFNRAGTNEIYITNGAKNIEKYTFQVSEPSALEEGENQAPKYIDAENAGLALATFRQALLKATYAEYDGSIASIRLGDKLAIPDMRNLVYDDHTSYANMSHTVYYKTPSNSSSTTAWNIPIDKPGVYEFYVVFEDAEGNAMVGEDFYSLEDDTLTTGKYYPYVFTFEIVDDAPIKVTALAQTKGYVGTTYTISSFRIEGSDYTATYELFYNANQSAPYDGSNLENNWVHIPASAEVDEDDVFADGLTYDIVKSIAYNGSLSFTPDKTGAYAIRCTVTAKASGKTQTAISVVKVNDTPKPVKVDTKWLQNNIWPITFLSVGTLCLIGVVVLLFIKPKEENK